MIDCLRVRDVVSPPQQGLGRRGEVGDGSTFVHDENAKQEGRPERHARRLAVLDDEGRHARPPAEPTQL